MPATNDISMLITTGKAGSGKDAVLDAMLAQVKITHPNLNITIEKFANTMKHMINKALLSRVRESIGGNLSLSEPLINQAIPHYLELADNNNPLANYNLGLLYENGAGVPSDLEMALVFYTDAAEHSKGTNINIYEDSLTKIASLQEKLISNIPLSEHPCATSLSEETFEALKNDGNLKFTVGKDENGSDIKSSIREVLQVLGTDIIRDVSKNFHIAMLSRKMLKSDSDLFALADVRFDNELLFVSTVNSFPTIEQKYDFLNSVATLCESDLPLMDDLSKQLEDEFGTGNLTTVLYDGLVDCFYNPDFTTDSFSSKQLDHQSLLDGEYMFDSPPFNPEFDNHGNDYEDVLIKNLRLGVIPLSRGNSSDRAMDSTHNSEQKSVQIDKIVNDSSLPQGTVFLNNTTPIADNAQYRMMTDIINSDLLCKTGIDCAGSSRQP